MTSLDNFGNERNMLVIVNLFARKLAHVCMAGEGAPEHRTPPGRSEVIRHKEINKTRQPELPEARLERSSSPWARHGNVVACAFLVACTACSRDRPVPTRAAPKETAEIAVVQAAIDAHGGLASFAKAKTGQAILRIDDYDKPDSIKHQTEYLFFQLPDKYRSITQHHGDGRETLLNTIAKRNRTWIEFEPGTFLKMPSGPPSHVYPTGILDELPAMLKSYNTLSLLPAEDIRGRPADHIQMKSSTGWTRDLFFDQETHLFVAAKHETLDLNFNEKHLIAKYYTEYREVQGLCIPMRIEITDNGEPLRTTTVTEVEFLDKIDKDVFANPVARP